MDELNMLDLTTTNSTTDLLNTGVTPTTDLVTNLIEDPLSVTNSLTTGQIIGLGTLAGAAGGALAIGVYEGSKWIYKKIKERKEEKEYKDKRLKKARKQKVEKEEVEVEED